MSNDSESSLEICRYKWKWYWNRGYNKNKHTTYSPSTTYTDSSKCIFNLLRLACSDASTSEPRKWSKTDRRQKYLRRQTINHAWNRGPTIELDGNCKCDISHTHDNDIHARAITIFRGILLNNGRNGTLRVPRATVLLPMYGLNITFDFHRNNHAPAAHFRFRSKTLGMHV